MKEIFNFIFTCFVFSFLHLIQETTSLSLRTSSSSSSSSSSSVSSVKVCNFNLCSHEYMKSLDEWKNKPRRRNQESRRRKKIMVCSLLHSYDQCLVNQEKQCRGDVQFHGLKSIVKNEIILQGCEIHDERDSSSPQVQVVKSAFDQEQFEDEPRRLRDKKRLRKSSSTTSPSPPPSTCTLTSSSFSSIVKSSSQSFNIFLSIFLSLLFFISIKSSHI